METHKKLVVMFIVAVALISILTPESVSGFTPRIGYLGYSILNASSGTNYNGVYPVNSSVYTVATGGSPVFTQHNASINISDGTFGIILTKLTGITYSSNLWIEVKIGTDTISPRLELVSFPQAMYSIDAGTLGTKSEANLNVNYSTYSGTAANAQLLDSLDSTAFQQVLDNCSAGESIREVRWDGSVVCEADSSGTDDQTCAEVSGCVENAITSSAAYTLLGTYTNKTLLYSVLGTYANKTYVAGLGYITDGNTGWDNSYGFYSALSNFTGAVTDTKYCTYDSAGGQINCTSDASGTDTYTNETQVDAWVSNNGYLTSYIDSYTNETQVDAWISNNGYYNSFSNISAQVNASCDARDTDTNTYNSSLEMFNAVNASSLLLAPINCSNIMFGTVLGATGICDGDDDAGAGTYDLNVSGDTGSGVLLNSEIFTIAGGANCTTTMSGNTLTIDCLDTDTDTYTNETQVDSWVSNNGYLTTYTDTNETGRFNTLVATNCGGTNKMVGVNATGGVECAADVDTTGSGGNSTEQMQDAVGSGFSTGLLYLDASNLFRVNITYFNKLYLNITKISTYANKTWVNTQLRTYTNLTKLTTYANKTWLVGKYMNITKMSTYVNKSLLTTYTNKTWLVGKYMNITKMTTYANKTWVMPLLSTYSNKTWVNTRLATYTNKTLLYSTLGTYTNKTWLNSTKGFLFTSALANNITTGKKLSSAQVQDVWVNTGGDTMTGDLKTTANINITADNKKMCFGAANDACMYWNGTALIID